MSDLHPFWTFKRGAPRISVDAFCSEIVGGSERHGVVVDLSQSGLRIERPFFGGPTPREMQLEFELPGLDEIVWAKGDVCFDRVLRGEGGGIVRSTGVRLARAASRDLRLLRDLVMEKRRLIEAEESVTGYLLDATSYNHG